MRRDAPAISRHGMLEIQTRSIRLNIGDRLEDVIRVLPRIA